MHWLQKIKDSPNYPRLKDSVDYRYWRKQFLLMAGILGGAFLLMLLAVVLVMTEGDEGNAAAIMGLFFIAMVYLGLLAYFAYQWLVIFLHINSYTFCEVMLDHPHLYGRGAVSFSVEVTDRRGKKLTKETSKMFHSEAEPYFEEYNNQKVQVGYNEETDRIVVIRLAR